MNRYSLHYSFPFTFCLKISLNDVISDNFDCKQIICQGELDYYKVTVRGINYLGITEISCMLTGIFRICCTFIMELF